MAQVKANADLGFHAGNRDGSSGAHRDGCVAEYTVLVGTVYTSGPPSEGGRATSKDTR